MWGVEADIINYDWPRNNQIKENEDNLVSNQ